MYAADTSVAVEKSQRHIEDLVTHAGASSFMRGTDDLGRVVVAFKMLDRRIMFEMPKVTVDEARSQKKREQLERAKWRALFLCIKAKLVGVEAGVETFDEAFMPHIVVPGIDGRATRFSAMAIKAIAETYKRGGTPQLALEAGNAS